MPSISITQALAEIKLLGKRIQSTLNDAEWMAVSTKTRPVDVERLKKTAQATEQSYLDLVKRRSLLKQAVVQSNATTVVKIGEWSGTVAEAIEKKSSIAYQQDLLESMRKAFVRVTEEYNREQDASQSRLDRLLSSELGKDVRTNPETIAALTTTFKDNNKVDLIDPLHLSERIKSLEAEIDSFTTNVDWVLAESNGRSMIAIA
jgi:hypothetical protein